MNINISSVQFDADIKLKDFITNRLEKLNKFFDKINGVEVFLKLSNNQEVDNKIVEIKLLIPGQDLFAKKQSKTFEEATDEVVDALKSQLVKRKDKIRK